jgi:hypothetical protein
MAQCLIYAYQAEMGSREDMTTWLEGYIREALPYALPDDLPFFLEEVLKAFARPLDAHGLRAHLGYLWQTEQRAGVLIDGSCGKQPWVMTRLKSRTRTHTSQKRVGGPYLWQTQHPPTLDCRPSHPIRRQLVWA